MKKRKIKKTSLNKRAVYFSRNMLELKPDVAGARMWGVALDKVLLTYFEMKPNCKFIYHRHKSEQITMVLSGELFFKLKGRTVCLKKGEVIAIPSNVAHAVYTAHLGVRAIDAWSPVMKQYKK